jgi:hypothetical protein
MAALFSPPVTTNDAGDVTVFAYLGATLAGSHVFEGAGAGGSFAGVELLGGLDHIVIDVAENSQWRICPRQLPL